MSLTIKDALYRELRYGVCGVGGPLHGILDPANIKLDMRNVPSATKSDAEYPWCIFRRVTESEDNQVNYDRARIEIELVGLRSSATKGDDLLEQMKDIVKDYFKNQTKTWGQFQEDGTPDATTGLRMKGIYLSGTEGFSGELDEKVHLLIFSFNYLRS